MKDILVVFIALLILTAILYYIKIFRDSYVNALSVQSANDQYSTLLRLESTTNNLTIDQEQLMRNFNDYRSGLDSQISTIDNSTTQFQVNTNSQLEDIRKTHLLNSDIIGKFSSNLSDVTARVAKESDWTHVVYGELLQTSKKQQSTIDTSSSKYNMLKDTVRNNNNLFNTRLNNIGNSANTALTTVSTQVNTNYDKTFADVNMLTNNVNQINTAMGQASNSIQQVSNNITAIRADYLPKNVFNSSFSDVNNNLNNLKNDSVSKATLVNNVNTIQGKFANYPTTQDIVTNYYPLKSGQTLEGSVKTMEGKVANLGATPDYITKSMLNTYYDKTGVDGAITTKLNGYVTTTNGGNLYYPLKSGQTLESSVKGFDTKITTTTMNTNALASSKLCLGATCIDEPQLIKLFGATGIAVPK